MLIRKKIKIEDGNMRMPTSIQQMNIHVDGLAGDAYANVNVTKVAPETFIKNNQPRVFKGAEEITGN